jgi:hypothetical protein
LLICPISLMFEWPMKGGGVIIVGWPSINVGFVFVFPFNFITNLYIIIDKFIVISWKWSQTYISLHKIYIHHLNEQQNQKKKSPHSSPISLLSNTKCSLIHNMLSKLGVNLENLHPIIVRYNGNLSSHNMKWYDYLDFQ